MKGFPKLDESKEAFFGVCFSRVCATWGKPGKTLRWSKSCYMRCFTSFCCYLIDVVFILLAEIWLFFSILDSRYLTFSPKSLLLCRLLLHRIAPSRLGGAKSGSRFRGELAADWAPGGYWQAPPLGCLGVGSPVEKVELGLTHVYQGIRYGGSWCLPAIQ